MKIAGKGGQPQQRKESVEALQAKGNVFKKGQNTQIEQDTERQKQPAQFQAGFRGQPAGLFLCMKPGQKHPRRPGGQGTCKQEQTIPGIPLHIEIITCGQQPDVSEFKRQQIIKQDCGRQKQHIPGSVEQHRQILLKIYIII